jgi:hypothetical protein
MGLLQKFGVLRMLGVNACLLIVKDLPLSETARRWQNRRVLIFSILSAMIKVLSGTIKRHLLSLMTS